jgi:hypothetical protein
MKTQTGTTPRPSPISEQKGSVIFMLFLLIISALTATIVGYRVKTADTERKAQLLEAYQRIGGSFSDSLHLGSTKINTLHHNDAQKTFILAYETNSRARAYGLARVIESTDPTLARLIIDSLFRINASEGAKSFRDAWDAYINDPITTRDTLETTTSKGSASRSDGFGDNPPGQRRMLSPRASRFARQYDRHIARDTEVKLYLFLRNNSGNISDALIED